MIKESLTLLKLQDFVWLLGFFLVIIVTIVQHLSTKYKPWSWLAEQFGKAVNKEMINQLDNIKAKVNDLEKRDVEQDKKAEIQEVKSARRRILQCSDEIRKKDRHSEEYFNDVLDDISYYKQYCKNHPEFENEKAVLAIKLVERTYEKCVSDNDFL